MYASAPRVHATGLGQAKRRFLGVQHIEIRRCTSLTSDGLIEFLKRVSAMELKHLHLDIAEIGTVDDSVLKAIGIVL